MPEYDYRCPNGHDITITRSIHDGPPATIVCPLDQCELEAVRVWTSPVLVFDGKGHGVGHVSTKWAYE